MTVVGVDCFQPMLLEVLPPLRRTPDPLLVAEAPFVVVVAAAEQAAAVAAAPTCPALQFSAATKGSATHVVVALRVVEAAINT